ncbi:hypothetical protein [Sphingomonas sp.]|uniref:hypothetical protein n=1 Tax=Sphingomonas sp. TaxID=28214 RepID=UPI0025FE274B|nr:hypothetical protein [Sphingomonas sp.]
MINAVCFERPSGSPKDELETRCAECGRAICDHPDPIYGGIVPSPHLRPEVEAREG